MGKNKFGGINLTVPTNVLEIKSLSTNQKIIWAIIVISLITSIYFLFRKASFSTFGEILPVYTPSNIIWNNGNTKLNDKCLYVKDGYSKKGQNGLPVNVGNCKNNKSLDPNYLFNYNNDNTISWVNDSSIKGKCLAVNEGMSTDGVNDIGKLNKTGKPFLQLTSCDKNDPNQLFSLDNNQLAWINNGTIQNQCINIPNGVETKQFNVDTVTGLWPCSYKGETSNPNLNFKMKYT